MLAVACSFLASGAAALAQPSGAGGPGWIDVHSHIYGRGGNTRGVVPNVLEAMNRNGISRILLMPPPQVRASSQHVDAEQVAAAAGRAPGRIGFLAGGGSLNILLHDAASGQVTGSVRRAFEERAAAILRMGAAGFGEMAALHISHDPSHPYEAVPADHPLLLLLSDIAARAGVPIDLHMDLVTSDMPPPSYLSSPRNPPVLHENLSGLERLLAHNRGARIVWAHAGSDPLGNWTPQLSRQLLARHPNLHMSLRVGRTLRPEYSLLAQDGTVRPGWLEVFRAFPDRFVLGVDQFLSARPSEGGPLSETASRGDKVAANSRRLLQALPPALARRLAVDNALKLYGRR